MKTTLEAMVVPVDGLPYDVTLEADEKGSFLPAMQGCVGGPLSPWGSCSTTRPPSTATGRASSTPPRTPPNRVIYATREMVGTGYASPNDYSRTVNEGEVIDIAFGDLLCIGFDAETGESRDITPEERARVMQRFGSAASIASGLYETMRIAYEARTRQR